MKFIRNIIQQFTKQDKKILGRWNIVYCDKQLNSKIELSNEDHCGTCGEYILDKKRRNIVNTYVHFSGDVGNR